MKILLPNQIPNVSVIFATLTGLDDVNDNPAAAIAKLNKLIAEFDQAAERNGCR